MIFRNHSSEERLGQEVGNERSWEGGFRYILEWAERAEVLDKAAEFDVWNMR